MASTLFNPDDSQPIEWGLAVPWVIGMGAALVTISIEHALKAIKVPFAFSVLVWVLAFGASAAFARSRLPGQPGKVAGMFFLGIPVGVIVDVVIDHFVFAHDRNLFPIEIVIVCVLAAVPVFAGIGIGRFFERPVPSSATPGTSTTSTSIPAPQQAQAPDAAPVATTPALWNPWAAGLWSLLLTPILGAFLQWRNWEALGHPEKVATARAWTYGWMVICAIGWVVSLRFGESPLWQIGSLVVEGALLLAWWVGPTRDQIQYIQRTLGGHYRHMSWAEPLLVAVALMAGVFILNMLLVPLLHGVFTPR